ncbi:peptidylprolyl isomerase [Parasphingorhabdus sp.]|jgi:peptidylprolyl isomerase|uniref:peptidylprolyl isomerase n=1 Tax=Parasphingorhabdus sp. TaxID=2709688 RepID=UPI003D2A989E
MRKMAVTISLAALAVTTPLQAQETQKTEFPSPNAIVDTAPASEWVTIAPSDLLVMDLAPDAAGEPRRVIIQLMPAPFSQGWIGNIRKLAAAKFWDGTSINRVQDNYVVQWGDAGYDNPESGETEQKALPEDLETVPESEYAIGESSKNDYCGYHVCPLNNSVRINQVLTTSEYGTGSFSAGWPLALQGNQAWPVHCYGAVGVGRNYSPDTGSGAELYTVIGHAPRHLDRNIAVVGRIIEGIEHLSSLPRGKGQLGFYADASKRVPITSIRLGGALDEGTAPAFEYLDTNSEVFAKYADARANRRDPFFIKPAGGADICNIPVPVRRVSGE